MRKYHKWNKQDIIFLCENYGKIRMAEIAKILSVSESSIEHKATQLKLKSFLRYNKYNVDHDFFRILNNENCYWAGFIAADGCISKRDNGIEIHISNLDKQHLQKFANAINFTGHITSCPKDTCRIRIHSNQWKKDLLNNFNIVPAKSLILQPPNLFDINHKLSFMKGYLDGDGSIYYLSRDKYINMSFNGTESMLTWIKNEIEKIEKPKRVKSQIIHKRKNDKCCNYHVYGKRAYKIISYLKEIKTPELERKWNKINKHSN